MRHFAVFFLGLILLASAVSAQEFEWTYDVNDATIYPDEEATFNLTIHNLGKVTTNFQLYSTDSSWVVDVDPGITPIKPNSSESVTLGLHPKESVGTGSRIVPIRIKSLRTGNIDEKEIFVYIKAYDTPGLEIQPSVALGASFKDPIDPRVDLAI